MIFNDYFKNIFLINMDQHTQRLATSKIELKKYNIDFVRVTGVLLNNGATVQDRRLGCTLTHLNIIKDAKKNNLENVVIFEDDIEFNPLVESYLPVIKDFIENNNWHIFYFGGNHLGKEKSWVKITDKVRRVNRTYTTHAYIINKNCYDLIIDGFNENLVIDQTLIRKIQPLNKSFCCLPNMAYQRNEFSYIMNANRNYDCIRKG